MRNIAVFLVLVAIFGMAYADTTVSATLVAVQTHRYDMQTIANTINTATQNTRYSMQTVAGTTNTAIQNTRYSMQTVAGTSEVNTELAVVPEVNAYAVYNSDNNQTTVTVTISSPQSVPTYYVFIYDPFGNVLASYSTSSTTSTHTINGKYDKVVVVVIANAIGISGKFYIPSYAAPFVLGTNVIPVRVDKTGTFDVDVYGGYALTPIKIQQGQDFYVVATRNVVVVGVQQG